MLGSGHYLWQEVLEFQKLQNVPPPYPQTTFLPPFQTFALNSCPPQRLYIRVLRHMTIHQSTYHAKYVMKIENPYEIY